MRWGDARVYTLSPIAQQLLLGNYHFLLSVIRRLMIDVLHWHGDDPIVRGYFAIFSVTMTLMIGRRREPALLINYADDILKTDNKI